MRLLGTVGEPINPEAWMWYHEVIGDKRCPIVDTWWQTETGGIMITPLPGATPTKPGTATLPFFGVVPEVVDDQGQSRAEKLRRQAGHSQAVAGHVARHLGRPEAFHAKLIGAKSKAAISPATAAARTRTAISGSSAALTTCSTSPAIASARRKWKARWSAIVKVAEAAVVGRPDELKGQALVAFVTLKTGVRRRAVHPRGIARPRRQGNWAGGQAG